MHGMRSRSGSPPPPPQRLEDDDGKRAGMKILLVLLLVADTSGPGLLTGTRAEFDLRGLWMHLRFKPQLFSSVVERYFFVGSVRCTPLHKAWRGRNACACQCVRVQRAADKGQWDWQIETLEQELRNLKHALSLA